MRGDAPLPILCLLFITVPHQGQNRFTGTISRFRRRYKDHNEELNASLGHKGALMTVPRNGTKKNIFRDKNIEEICPFPRQRRCMLYFIIDIFYLENGHFLVWVFGGRKRPPSPRPAPLRKHHGDNFPVPPSVQGFKCERINAPLWHKGAPLSTLCLL